MTSSYAAYREALRGQPLPAAYVDLDAFDANARAVLARGGDLPVRVASKSVRCVALLARLRDLDARFSGFMCYAAAEAVHLSRAGFDDLLLGYPIAQPHELRAIAEEVGTGKRIIAMVDEPGHVTALADVADAVGVVMPVCMDLDMSSRYPGLHFGVRRSPVRDVAAALALAEAIRARPSLRLVGLMGYEAQLAGVPDAAPGAGLRNWVVRGLQRASRREVFARRAAVVAALKGAGFSLEFVNGGGTGSLEATRGDASVTELTAGSAFYAPTLFDGYRGFRHAPAAGFALAVVRRPEPDVYTCAGGGYVASGSAEPAKLPRPFLPEGAALFPTEGAGEVQTPVRYAGTLDLGDPVFFRHAKAGELCERFTELLLMQGGAVIGRAPTYRGEGKCFM